MLALNLLDYQILGMKASYSNLSVCKFVRLHEKKVEEARLYFAQAFFGSLQYTKVWTDLQQKYNFEDFYFKCAQKLLLKIAFEILAW